MRSDIELLEIVDVVFFPTKTSEAWLEDMQRLLEKYDAETVGEMIGDDFPRIWELCQFRHAQHKERN